MSTLYSAATVIGIAIPRKDLMKTIKKRGCGHEARLAKHCSECGKPMWVEEETPSPEYEGFITVDEKFCGLDAIAEGYDPEDLILYVGIIYEVEQGSVVFNQAPNIEEIKAKIEKALAPKGLWNIDRFGIYTVCCIS